MDNNVLWGVKFSQNKTVNCKFIYAFVFRWLIRKVKQTLFALHSIGFQKTNIGPSENKVNNYYKKYVVEIKMLHYCKLSLLFYVRWV